MSIIEKIKQFFKNIGKKPKMIEAPQYSHMKITIKDELKDKDLKARIAIDPKACLKENLVPNILKTLGVRDEIRNNPRFVHLFEHKLEKIIKEKGINIPEEVEQIPGEQVDAIIGAIKSKTILTEEQIAQKYSEVATTDNRFSYQGIEVDSITGEVLFQDIDRNMMDKEEYNEVVTQKFIYDDKNNMKMNKEYILKGKRKENIELTYNSDGIEMEEISSLYNQNGEEYYHNHCKRDEKHPSIMKVFKGDQVEYQAIDTRDMSKLKGPKIGQDKQGKTTSFTFKNYEEVEKYCEEYRQEIYSELGEKPQGYPKDSKLEKALNVGTNKLAIIVALEDRTDNEQEK